MEKVELKRFLDLENHSLVKIDVLSRKEPELRSQEEKTFLQLYLKFKVPFFKTF